MKNLLLAAFVTILTLSAPVTQCSAQSDRTVTSTSKKGSLLIWPLIRVTPADTIIKLNNEYYKGVKVRCAYDISFASRHLDWVFNLLPNQPISWLASTGQGPDGNAIPQAGDTPPALAAGSTAVLTCWAVDTTETQQIVWNWLTGGAVVGEGAGQHWQYSAWRFAVNSSTTGAAAGDPGMILLSGDSGNYDACPESISFNILRQTPNLLTAFPRGTVSNYLTLVPCWNDLRKDLSAKVFTQLKLRDENGYLQPVSSVVVGFADRANEWFSESLSSKKLNLGKTSNPFTRLGTPGGSILVHGRANASYPGTLGMPLIGVISGQFVSPYGPVAGETPTAVGHGQAYIRDAAEADTGGPVFISW